MARLYWYTYCCGNLIAVNRQDIGSCFEVISRETAQTDLHNVIITLNPELYTT